MPVPLLHQYPSLGQFAQELQHYALRLIPSVRVQVAPGEDGVIVAAYSLDQDQDGQERAEWLQLDLRTLRDPAQAQRATEDALRRLDTFLHPTGRPGQPDRLTFD